MSKVFERSFANGVVRDLALTAGFDLNTKNTRFAPRKRLLVVGPTIKFDVPGFSRPEPAGRQGVEPLRPGRAGLPRAQHRLRPPADPQRRLGHPLQAGPLPLKFQGFINYNTAKGRDYAGTKSAAQDNVWADQTRRDNPLRNVQAI